jgi:hypothetical protein
MRYALAMLVVMLGAVPALGHPGWGVVRDSRGNVYYTDLRQVWRVDPQSRKSVAVPNVHTHELYLDAQDNLYGEHLWYEGDATKKWGHFLWKFSADGKYTQITPREQGFRGTEASFVRDAAGSEYWREGAVLKKRSPAGQMSTVATLPQPAGANEGGILTATPDGVLYTIMNGALWRIAPDGSSRMLARGLAQRTIAEPFVQPWHVILGLCADGAGNVYFANTGARVTKKFGTDGRTTVFLRAHAPWTPSGVYAAANGDVYVLEYADMSDRARVRRVSRDGAVSTLP